MSGTLPLSGGSGPPEWLICLRGWLAYVIAVHTPIDRVWWGAFLWLLPYAGDWIYREQRREFAREKAPA